VALLFLLVRPEGLFGEKHIDPCDRARATLSLPADP